MRQFKIAVGNNLKNKIGELGFFLEKIIELSKVIEQRDLKRDYPLNEELDKLNFFFSAYLNTIQSLKDAFKAATGANFSWKDISPTYGNFVYFCRNATTHDGSHLINAGKEGRSYIAGPLRRIDNHKKVITFDPPNEDVFSLCCNLTDEILQSLTNLLKREGENILVLADGDFNDAIQTVLASDFMPNEVKGLIQSNIDGIEASFKGIKVDIVHQTIKAIANVARIVEDSLT